MSTYRDQFLDFFEICDKYIKIGPFDFWKSRVCILIAALMTFSYLMPYL
jgi:hypothetical protein